MDVGSFALGQLKASTFQQKDWTRSQKLFLYQPQFSQMAEIYKRGFDKCSSLPPLFKDKSKAIACSRDGCQAELKPIGPANNTGEGTAASLVQARRGGPPGGAAGSQAAGAPKEWEATGGAELSWDGTNFCSRMFFEFEEYFITHGVIFGSIYNQWAIIALLSMLGTQLNNLNLVNILFPMRTKKSDRRVVSPGLTYLTLGFIKENHCDLVHVDPDRTPPLTDDEASESDEEKPRVTTARSEF